MLIILYGSGTAAAWALDGLKVMLTLLLIVNSFSYNSDNTNSSVSCSIRMGGKVWYGIIPYHTIPLVSFRYDGRTRELFLASLSLDRLWSIVVPQKALCQKCDRKSETSLGFLFVCCDNQIYY